MSQVSVVGAVGPGLVLDVTVRVELQVSPDVRLLADLLVLPQLELAEAVNAELAENPALAVRDIPRCPACAPRRCRCGALPLKADPVAPDDPARELVGDLADTDLGPVVAFLLADLDRRGLLDRNTSAVARQLGVTVEQVERALDALAAVAPPGLGAPNLAAALARQAARIDPEIAGLVGGVAARLEAVDRGATGEVAAELSVSTSDVEAALAFMRERLRPCTGLDARTHAPPPPPPDVVLRAVGADDLEAQVTADPSQWLVLDPLYRAIAEGRRANGLSRAEQQDATRWARRADAFIRQVGRRRTTIEAVAETAGRRQLAFLDSGPAHHQPLTRVEVANTLGVHESTVSRAVKGKVVQAPSGACIELASLFGSSVSAVEALRELLASHEAPSTDAALAAELCRLGHRVARRTVTKYRHRLANTASF